MRAARALAASPRRGAVASRPALAHGTAPLLWCGAMRALLVLLALALAPAAPAAAQPLDRVTFATNWKAEAEHGGFYQAVAAGIYRRHGLDVMIRMGGPQVNNPQLMGASSFSALNYARGRIPVVTVAAIFQKDPQVLIAHPGQGHDSLPALRGKPIMISPSARVTFWQFLKLRYGYRDEQIRPYTFNLAPFLSDKRAIQQGYLTSEPYAIRKAGVTPVVHVLADHGFDSYSTTIECQAKLVRERPDLVQRFVDASVEGWYSYLYGDPAPGNALIKRDNPEMTDDLLAFGIAAMKEHGVVDSGDALTLGIGAMTDARWRAFAAAMIGAGVYPRGLDVEAAYTLRFVNRKVGMSLKPAAPAR
jgi:NitT/TauT family transport system substrate-binding protein